MKNQRTLIILFWGGILTLFFTGLILYFNLHRRSSLGDTIVVQVNERKLTAKEFSEKLAENLQDYDALLAKDTHVVDFAKNKIVEDFVHDSLVLDWAKRNSVTVSQEEVEKEVQKIRSNYPDDASFREALSHSQQTLDQWEDSMGQRLLQKKVFQALASKITPPTDDEMKSFYNSNKETFRVKPQVRIRQIVLDNEDTANRIYHSLNANMSLEPLAKKYSIAPEASRGGDVGWIEQGSLDIFDKAFNMKVGQRGGVYKSPYGYHIIEVTGKKPEQLLTFDEVKSKIERNLRSNKEQAIYSAWLEEQLRIAKVYKNDTAIKAIEVRPLGD